MTLTVDLTRLTAQAADEDLVARAVSRTRIRSSAIPKRPAGMP